MTLTHWLRRPRAGRPRHLRPLEQLETRDTPAFSATLGPLTFFSATGTNAGAGPTAVDVAGPVQVGFTPPAGQSMLPLLRVADGGQLKFDTADTTTFAFTVSGGVTAVVGPTAVPLFTAPAGQPIALRADKLTGPNGVGGLPGTAFGLSGGQFDADLMRLVDPTPATTGDEAVWLQGGLTYAAVPGLTLNVTGDDYVTITTAGKKLTGISPSVNVAFKLKGTTVAVDTPTVTRTVTAAGELVTVTGGGSVEFGEEGSIGVTLGGTTKDVVTNGVVSKGRQTAGLVLLDGALQEFGAAVGATFALGSTTFAVRSAAVDYTKVGDTFQLAVSGSADLDYNPGAAADTTTRVKAGVSFGRSTNGVYSDGLFISDGALAGVDLSVDGQFTYGKLTVLATAVRIQYTAPVGGVGETFLFAGSGSIQYTDAQAAPPPPAGGDLSDPAPPPPPPTLKSVGAAVTFGTRSAAGVISPGTGLAVVDGKLSGLQGQLDGDLTVAGLTVKAKGLALGYTTATATQPAAFTVAGEAKVVFAFSTDPSKAVELGVRLGDLASNTPGVVIRGSVLESLTAAAFADFSLGGVTFGIDPTDPLGLAYDRAAGRVAVYGGVAVSNQGSGGAAPLLSKVGVRLGTAAAPGLLLSNGKLEALGFAVTTKLNLGGLTLDAEGLGVSYTAGVVGGADAMLFLTGGVTLGIQGVISVGVALPNDGLGIDLTTGAVKITDLVISVGQIDLGFVLVKEGYLQYQQNTDGTINLTTKLDVQVPELGEVSGEFKIVENQIDTISLSLYSPEGIPLGDSGVTINGGSATLANLSNPSKTQLSGTLTASYGPTVQLFGGNYSLITMTGGFTLGAERAVVDATFDFLGGANGLGTSTGTLFADWTRGQYGIESQGSLLGGSFAGDLKLYLDTTGGLTVLDKLSINVPSVVPVIGGLNLGEGGFFFQFNGNKDDPTNNFIAGWTTGLAWEVGFRYGFYDNKYTVLNAKQIEDVESGTPIPVNREYIYTNTFTAPAGASFLGVTLKATEFAFTPDAAVTVEYTLPGGRTVTVAQSAFGPSAGIQSLNPPFQLPQLRLLTLTNPDDPTRPFAADTKVTVRVVSTVPLSLTIGATAGGVGPSAAVSAMVPNNGVLRAETTSAPVTIRVTSADPATTVVDLVYDSAATGAVGVVIARGLKLPAGTVVGADRVARGTLTYDWNLTDLVPDTYRVYAIVRDGVHSPVAGPAQAVTLVPQYVGYVLRNETATDNPGDLTPGTTPGQPGIVVFADINGNGLLDPGEPAGRTDAAGRYEFNRLSPLPERFSLVMRVPTGFDVQAGPVLRDLILDTTLNVPGTIPNPFVLRPKAGLSGRVFNDVAGSGRGAGQPGLAGWTVYLDTDRNGRLTPDEPTALTLDDGSYQFVTLAAGTNYFIRLIAPAGVTPVSTFPLNRVFRPRDGYDYAGNPHRKDGNGKIHRPQNRRSS